MTKIVLFDEKAKDIIPGIYNSYSFLDIPIWGNFRYRSLLDIIIDKYRDMGFKTIIVNWKDKGLSLILKETGINGCFISRVSSLVLSDLKHFETIKNGPIKLSIDKTPTDFYYLDGENIYELVNHLPTISSVQDLFKEYFFSNFLRIVDRDGNSFLARDAYEYYMENMKILKYLKNEEILSILGRMSPLSEVEAYVGGNVENSYIAPGSKVLGNVVNSIIFEGVEIGKDCYIESSVILPGNRLEEGVVVKNSLILGGTAREIGANSKIGDVPGGSVKINHSFNLRKGLTVIGEDINIPHNSYVGSYCVVAGKGKPRERLIVNDGEFFMMDFD